ncbi:UDP-GlcNAc:betaGal beta-1,3-N-acetylglucosaminyltransferase-like protein 1 [Galleria mellonella]|uniref:UDP-GlcNAc:betaGal beta-1,3-N-acetylglucosaminyltransferase-like protein 1 n=1 Tax=Galleria mellonella TaxID=7137 RepID=A0A6J3BTL0_GALME|nr:UDP-GlcNAc:betaGal beta-1,3-N-acetylglucosaminyltransferase-like protein 1 [Galleria mellonella]XP_031763070.1 UDP-GlcNAc:betaGal beta-1,3-N-acetylglucosaminyltransferase-like protein 1 [Galleria mellonella]
MADISIIIPIHNGEKWINSCMKSISAQSILKTKLKIEIAVFNDGSNDGTKQLLDEWAKYFNSNGIKFILTNSPTSRGVGAAKNGAVKSSVGTFLCFQDIDDIMHENRILLQWRAAYSNHNALIGSQISRIPASSTPRFVHWANTINSLQQKLQIYTSNGPTLLMPTWFCHRSIFEKVGGFDETGHGTPEDLIFFYKHLDLGGDVHRIDEKLVIYRYHEGATTFSIDQKKIKKIQLEQLEKCVFPHWERFTVWNAGKSGRKFVRSLSQTTRNKVIAFCDVDKKKIGKSVELYCPIKREVLKILPVVHFKDAKLPLLICVKLDLTNGEFEKNLRSLNLIEGIDYILFS